MRKKALITLFLLLAAEIIILFSACSESRGSNGSAETGDTPVKSNIDRDIIFVYIYDNWAWGWQCGGGYIDREGYWHDFDLDSDKSLKKEEVQSIDQVLDLFESGYAADNKTIYITKRMAEDFYEDLKKIKSYEFDGTNHIGYDMGEATLYGVINDENGERVIIPIVSYGDFERRNSDKYAVKIAAELFGWRELF